MDKILIVGVGSAARNIVDRCLTKTSDINTLAIDTSIAHIRKSTASKKIQIGAEVEIDNMGDKSTLNGRHAGGKPELGEKAAKADLQKIKEFLNGVESIILVAGLGAGTGSGASPVIAESAKSMGIHVVSIVTTPFSFEGKKRRTVSLECIDKLEALSDQLIIFDNNEITKEHTSYNILSAFKRSDDIVSDIILEKYKELQQEDRTNEVPLH